MATSDDLVTVTGGSGFLASWIIATLLNQGYRVRATVRSAAKEPVARAAIAAAADAQDRLSFVSADLLADAGWDEAVRGARYVIHPASPMQVGEYAKTDVIRPAREGVRRVLTASAAAGVEQVVLTSSAEACTPASMDVTADESVWTDLGGKDATDYTKSKTLAEQDAWAFSREHPSLTLTTILPGFIQGPVLGADFSGSVELVARLLRGQVPVAPRLGFPIVDVRDLASLHVAAMIEPAARGKRLIATGEFLWILDIAALLRDRFPERAGKLPAKAAPDLLMRLAALGSAEIRQITPKLGRRQRFDAGLAQRLLGWTARPARDAVLDGAESLIRLGLA